MNITFTPTGGSAATLGDDPTKWFIQLEQGGAVAIEQVVPLLQSPSPSRQLLGNVSGDEVFTVKHSHASRDAAATYYKGQRATIGTQGSLVMTFTSTTFTFALANLRGVMAIERDGLLWTLRYTFGVTTMT